jgi:carboxymethylenebutenolidase
MNEIQQYLAEEIASDCGQGHITRSEALRRLRIMGVSAAVAFALLSACGAEDNGNNQAQTVAMNGATPAAPSTASNANNPAVTPMPNSASPSAPEGNVVPSAPPAVMPSAMTPPSTAPSNGMPPEAVPPEAMPPEAMPPEAMPPEAMPPAGDPAAISGPGMGLPTEAITFNGPNGPLQGAFAAAPQPRGAVLVIHENRGLNDHIRTVVGRFAAAGFTAIGLDLLSEEGGTGSLGDPANATAALGTVAPERFVADMQACLAELERRAPNAKIGAVGFCFGGGMMWRLIATKDPRLAAAAPFYGQLPMGADFTGSNTAVLAFYGELDTRINATRNLAEAALTSAGLTHELVTESGANHAFFNDTGANYNVAAATDAWSRVLAWFGEHLS